MEGGRAAGFTPGWQFEVYTQQAVRNSRCLCVCVCVCVCAQLAGTITQKHINLEILSSSLQVLVSNCWAVRDTLRVCVCVFCASVSMLGLIK